MAGGRKKRRVAKAPRRSLGAKLTLLVVGSVALAVALVAGASAWRDGARDAAQENARFEATAAVIASLGAEATANLDRARAFEALRPIARLPGVAYGRIELLGGRPLIETGAGARLTRDLRLSAGSRPGLLAQLRSRTVEIDAPIAYQGRTIGRVVLLTRSEGALDRLLASLGLSLAAAAAAAAFSVLLAQRLQKAITGPILALTRSMQQVQEDHNYGRTVEIAADDEVGQLVSGFNRMLAEIRERDDKIAAQVAGLEEEVAQRTKDYKAAAAEAEAANSAKSDFLATMSHEIRTPMNGMMVMAEMLAAGELPPRQRRYADVVAKSGASLLAILNDILDFSKIEAGKLELESMPLDLAETAEDVASLFWERASAKGLDLAVYADPATPLKIVGDPTRMRQVIGNLVNNAIKFTETGGVLIEIEPVRGGVRVSVRDTGIGIPADKIGGLFDAFSQADQSTTRRFGGTGLGLAICRRLVEAMGGVMQVSSRPGQGSTFAFRLPVEAVEGPAPWPAAAEAGGLALVRHGGVATERALNRYLARAGYTPRTEGEAPLVVVAAAAELEEAPSTAPTVCLAGYGETRPQALVRAGGAQAVLVQPFRRRDLQSLLAEVAAGLPLTDPAASPDPAAGDALPAFPEAHVLVADDSPVNREVAMEALARLGVRVTTVADGREAVERIKAGGDRIDLVLMDGSMPEMDGYDATRAIRAFEAETGAARLPIVALTAHVVGSAAEAWREAGMDAVLHKPFTLAALAAALGGFLTPGAAPVAAEPPAAGPAPSDRPDLLDPEVQANLAALAAGGRPDFAERVKRLYRENAPKAFAELAAATKARDAEGAARAAHALKSMSLNIGARAASTASAAIEAGGRSGAPPSLQAVEKLGETLAATLALLGPAEAFQARAAS